MESIQDSYTIAALAPPAVGAAQGFVPATSGQVRPPYVIADERVFEPQSPPVITGQGRPTIAATPPLDLAQPGSRGSISNMLRSTFEEAGGAGASQATRDQVARAYDQLKALGF